MREEREEERKVEFLAGRPAGGESPAGGSRHRRGYGEHAGREAARGPTRAVTGKILREGVGESLTPARKGENSSGRILNRGSG